MRAAPLLAALALMLPIAASARDKSVPVEFQKINPCPSTGKTVGACPGWVRDHVTPLCKGGADVPSNMQWQTIEDAKAKDKWECK